MDATRKSNRQLRFSVYEGDRETRRLSKQGRRIHLQDQPFQVLCMLIDRAGGVVTREELRQALWPGSIYVDFDHGLNNAIARLREALSDDAAAPTYIETLPRLGYRFIYPLETPPTEQPHPRARWRVPAWVAGGLLLVLALGWWIGVRDRQSTTAGPDAAVASIAVVPFASLTVDVEDGHFANGLSEELMTQLSRIPKLRVAGVGSSFRFQAGHATSAEIAKALNVDHLLEGSVRRSADRVRITTRLIEARTGRQLWAETFDRKFSDIFAIEDGIALAVTSALQVRLIDADGRQLRAHGTQNSEAYRLFLMGMAQLRARGVQFDRQGARAKFERAIALDPGFASAHAALASYHFNDIGSNYRSPEESWRLGLAAAERAHVLGPDNVDAMRVMADFEMLRFRLQGQAAAYRRATSMFERAIEAEPSNAYAHFDFARAIQWCEARRATNLFARADELDPFVPVALGLSALALDRLGEHDAAALRLQEFVARSGENYSSRNVAAYESYRGQLQTAASALAKTSAPFSLDIGTTLLLAGIYRSLGDDVAAQGAFARLGDQPLAETLGRAADMNASGQHLAAYELLEQRRKDYPTTHMLDVPAARMALIAGQNARASAILEQRLPDLARGDEDLTAPRVLPALDLVLAWSQAGHGDRARGLLARVERFLDGRESPRLPMFTVLRARAYALAGNADAAQASLDRAFQDGFRMTCHLDLHPQPLLYVDCLDTDPAFSTLRSDGFFQRWLGRIRDANRAP